MSKEDKFENDTISTLPKYKIGFDLEKLYEEAHNELTLQQSKRDQIITLYVTLFSLLLPISFSIDALQNYRALIFFILGVFGIVFLIIVLRYRIYKEVYWLACITIMDLTGYEKEIINKDLVQSIFYHNMYKKGKNVRKYYDEKKKKFHGLKFAGIQLKSAETLHYCLIAITTSLCFSFFAYSLCVPLFEMTLLFYFIPAGVFVILLLIFYHKYIKEVKNIYKVLIDKKESSFNATFEKAWFLFIND